MLFNIPLYKNSAEEVKDKYNIRELVEFERYCRDRQLWDQMEQCYHEDSEVHISWYAGTGKKFVEASKKMSGATHKIFNTVIWLKGNKAIAEIVASIQSHTVIDRKEVDLVSYVRLLYRVEKIGGIWKIRTLDCIYEKDSLLPVLPSSDLDIDPSELSEYRSPYQCLCYVLKQKGITCNQELPGEDRPDTVNALYQSVSNWIA